jgi:hypothetical protein
MKKDLGLQITMLNQLPIRTLGHLFLLHALQIIRATIFQAVELASMQILDLQ